MELSGPFFSPHTAGAHTNAPRARERERECDGERDTERAIDRDTKSWRDRAREETQACCQATVRVYALGASTWVIKRLLYVGARTYKRMPWSGSTLEPQFLPAASLQPEGNETRLTHHTPSTTTAPSKHPSAARPPEHAIRTLQQNTPSEP
jgi:hypothetical protein